MAMPTEVCWSKRKDVLLLMFHVRRSASYYNPLQWIQEKFAPKARKADPVEEKKRSEQEKQGQQSVFEAAVSHEKGSRPKTKSTETAPTVVKKKATEV
jgi:large subunit ribosomal protein L22